MLFYRKGDSLGIPPGWLCYLAPELVRSLHAHQAHNEDLAFGKASDVYAFGCVFFIELIIVCIIVQTVFFGKRKLSTVGI